MVLHMGGLKRIGALTARQFRRGFKMKKTYETPKMEKLGSFEALTMSTSTGSRFDAALLSGAVGGPSAPVLS